MEEIKKDCLSCSNSFSEETNDNCDILHCIIHNEKIVDEEHYCNDWSN